MTRKRTASLRQALKMMTIEEAAHELRITPGMVRGRMRSRKLPSVSLTDDGTVICIIRCELQTYAKRHRWELRYLQIMAAITNVVLAVGIAR